MRTTKAHLENAVAQYAKLTGKNYILRHRDRRVGGYGVCQKIGNNGAISSDIISGKASEVYDQLWAAIRAVEEVQESKPPTNADALHAALQNLVNVAQALPQSATHDGLALADALATARKALNGGAQPDNAPRFLIRVSDGMVCGVYTTARKPAPYLIIDEDAIGISAQDDLEWDERKKMSAEEIIRRGITVGFEKDTFLFDTSTNIDEFTAAAINAAWYPETNNDSPAQ